MNKTTCKLVCAGLLVMLPLRAASSARIEPNGRNWKTWVLYTGSQLRLPPPPDLAATAQELAALKDMQAGLDDNQRSKIAYWDQASPSYHWVQWLEQTILAQNVNTPNATRQMASLNVAIYDGMVAAWDSKYAYKRRLPSQVDASFRPLLPNSGEPSYPNEFAVAAGAAAAILSYFYPAQASALQTMAQEAGQARLNAGVAFPATSRRVSSLEIR